MKSILFSFLLLVLNISVFAQLPQAPQDISPLLVGETFPASSLSDPEGNPVGLPSLFAEKPSVVIFYRGGWCPYCTKHLSAIGQSEQEILAAGYQIIAISPDSPEKLAATYDKEEISYRLLSDADGTLAKAIGIAFQAPEKYADHLSKHSGGKNSHFLPVPSVFILDKEGKILFEHIDPDYQSRLEVDLLLAVVTALK